MTINPFFFYTISALSGVGINYLLVLSGLLAPLVAGG